MKKSEASKPSTDQYTQDEELSESELDEASGGVNSNSNSPAAVFRGNLNPAAVFRGNYNPAAVFRGNFNPDKTNQK